MAGNTVELLWSSRWHGATFFFFLCAERRVLSSTDLGSEPFIVMKRERKREREREREREKKREREGERERKRERKSLRQPG